MELSVNDQVQVTGKVLTKDKEVVNLDREPGVIKKVQGDHLYVETQHGTHYLPLSRVEKVE
ncbi:MAG: hypothetical protein R2827_03195 [Bdellovibrionales bacterium]